MNDLNLSGDVIAKGIIWRSVIREVKYELITQGFKSISFPYFLNKENNITQIEEGKYEIKDVVEMVSVDNKTVCKSFVAKVSLVGQGGLSCNVDELKILEEVS